ncbi:hypothetical protein, partial [Aquamicrobium defluvii]|uniref:hypothetical protein n=1 Tax=Aquamicrobium defluvii TaxID=69279 RepID=UPI001AACD073
SGHKMLNAVAHPSQLLAGSRDGANLAGLRHIRCLIPAFDGVIFSPEWEEALWARFYTAAPRRQRPYGSTDEMYVFTYALQAKALRYINNIK